MGRIPISDQDLKDIIASLDHRVRKIDKYIESKPAGCEDDVDIVQARAARQRASNLSWRLRKVRMSERR